MSLRRWFLCLLFTPALAGPAKGQDVKAISAESHFGSNQGITLVNAVNFQTPVIFGGPPMTENHLICSFDHYCFSSGGVMVAPLELPNGAVLDAAWLYYADSDCEEGNVTMLLGRQAVNFATAVFEDTTTIDSVSSTGCPGFAQFQISPGLTFRTVEDVGHDGDLEATSYVFYILSPSNNFQVSVHALELHWHRTISPAPGTATFTDVPTSHPAFKEIEAAVAAGVLRSCATGKLCPDNPVTRAQLAVYLARALGLHWPQ